MGEAIGAILPLGVGVALSPLPIIAVILMLVSRRAKVNGPMFILGWLLGLAAVGVVVLVIAGPADMSDGGEPSGGSTTLMFVLGALLVLTAMRQWRKRPGPGETAEMPKWMSAIDDFTPVKALGAGTLLSALNPKNLLLAVGAAAAVAQTEIAGGQQAVAYGIFVLIGTIGVAIPVVIFFALGDKAPALLDKLRVWMAAHNAVIMSVLCLVIGAKLIGDGIAGL